MQTIVPRLVMADAPKMQRTIRGPKHPFNVRQEPWQIQPLMIAPVLPGETLKGFSMSARIVSDPLNDKLMGWWAEHMLFYVKLTDLDIGEDLVDMMINGSADLSAHYEGANIFWYHQAGGINFVKKCLQRIVAEYFRDEDEDLNPTVGGTYAARLNHEGWWDSARIATQPDPTDHELPGDNPKQEYDAPDEFATHYAQWEKMVSAGFTTATYEDYLKAQGVRVSEENKREQQRPELLRETRSFGFPTNTVEPTTGQPSSAAVFSLDFSADKDRYFKEPGFLMAVQVMRPKVMLKGVTSTMTSFMDHYANWLPAVLSDDPHTSLVSFAPSTGPVAKAFSNDYWADMKDLFLHGEQFRNHDGSTQGNGVAAPTGGQSGGDFNAIYPLDGEQEDMFVNPAGGLKYFRTDGIALPRIASPVGRDTTPSN